MTQLADVIQATADWLFIPFLVIILFGTGLFMTGRLGAVQVRRFGEALRSFFGGHATGSGALTPFQSFMTALGATIGTGNIAGVAAGIVSGGPGVLFWIWCYGFFATSIKFSEAVLGMTFRETQGDQVRSGPMYYLRDGVKSPLLAMSYAVVAGIAALTTTPFTQTNSIALVFDTQVGVPRWISGIVIALLTWLVIIGGIKSIGRVAEKLAPLKVILYLLGSLVVIVTFAAAIPEVLAMVFRYAFTTHAVFGFGIFTAVRYGLARGLYANEAGYGTAAVAYGTAQSNRPSQQGLNAVMETFIVSFGTCTLTALTVLLSGVIDWTLPVSERVTSTAAVGLAFDAAMPGFGGYIVAFCVFLFGYGTLIGWAFYGEQFLEYWLGPRVVMPYRWIYCLLIPLGAITRVELVWAWGDLMNALQIFPNLIGVLALSGIAAKIAHDRSRPRIPPS
ncbi:MAG: sodium:alanine symporter family protein [Acidobacteria bacterium]|nr:sodium:alanine symporter family protein [Acidobacteriota bacterium]MBA3884851.1 sodium:alanine symporter family protein [Acidobacteriota bacterium]